MTEQFHFTSNQVAKVLGMSYSISPFNEYSRLISFRTDWFHLLAVQGTLKSLLQHDNLKASNLWCLAFFMVQPSYLYMTTGKIIALTIWTFVGKVMSLLFNMLSRSVIAFLPRNFSFNFMAEVTICSDFGVQQNKVCHCDESHALPQGNSVHFPGLDSFRKVFAC